jgi:poly-gamma-glutamate synthesis protein (capsule biosynthesis protein)
MNEITLFLCGDVMTGRGIDQILAEPCDPAIHEPYLQSALEYVELAEAAHGAVPRRVPPGYIWGDALTELDRVRPDARIVNLETAVTTSDGWVAKGINYRMHPANVACLSAAQVDCCVLANNHVLDWGPAGLLETLDTLRRAGIRTAGAGRDLSEARAPAIVPLAGERRVLVFAYGMESSGIPPEWAASERTPGVNFLEDLSPGAVERIARDVLAAKRAGDVVVLSIHWGGNWGYHVAGAETAFAHALIDRAGVDVVHGHSSHHPKAIEVYRRRPILYGCGDLVNDYEGIRGYESFRPGLSLLYFTTLRDGALARLEAVPFRMRRFRLESASREDGRWLARVLQREARRFDTTLRIAPGDRLEVGPVE